MNTDRNNGHSNISDVLAVPASNGGYRFQLRDGRQSLATYFNISSARHAGRQLDREV